MWTQSNINITEKTTIYKILIFALDSPHYGHIYKESFANILCYYGVW